ncbi:enoyl-CoA hydratase-related protein [uncultured Tistrella sp.]|uniref:enoyl-CoA hydratase-related protein n=1 Tax=Tistrella mobilis TaxID=171437 RepID=UPI000C09A6E2|nr:enoyl-CoA hydratase-related protein [uncultured Tistrella sp.]MAM72786.1 2-(1,2-epoxy-1,2-dihydrophenyl)acetyl-CoA isomerase [Tistrella sp.]
MTQDWIKARLDETGVGVLTLNRAEIMNALSPPLLDALAREIDALVENGARSLVITGAGRAFCAGADLGTAAGFEAQAREEAGTTGLQHFYHPFLRKLRACPVPLVAAVNGVAGGAGMSLAMMCDIICAGRSAVFLQAFRNVGLVPDCGSTWLLPRLVGLVRARELSLLGNRLGAEQALAWGLVNRVFADDELLDGATALARALADGPVGALGRIRQLYWESPSNDFETQLDLEDAFQSEMSAGPDFREGVAAFLEKRRPDFRNPG